MIPRHGQFHVCSPAQRTRVEHELYIQYDDLERERHTLSHQAPCHATPTVGLIGKDQLAEINVSLQNQCEGLLQ